MAVIFRDIPPLTSKDIDRFWSHVEKAPGDRCWLWLGECNSKGYGRFYCGGDKWPAPRIAIVISEGHIAIDMLACHRCETPRCVRPDHLWAATSIQRQA